jgi:hypothetical protein
MIGVREKPGGREKANRGVKKERGGTGRGKEGENEEKRNRDEEKKKIHQANGCAFVQR